LAAVAARNYMMLEFLLTRMDPNDERLIAAVEGLRFFVLSTA
jgi:hypothetical protein